MNWSQLIVPYALILGSLAAGLLIERVILVRVHEFARARARANADEAVSFGLRGAVVLWFVLAGIYAALRRVELGEPLEGLVTSFLRVNVLVSVTWVLMKVAARLITGWASRSALFSSSTIFANIARFVIGALGLLVVLQSVGIPIAPMLTTLGVGGIAVALALQDTLSNLFSGVYVLASHKIRIGDFVRLASGEEGYVSDINWRQTTIRALSNNYVIIPNATMASAIVTNFTLPDEETPVAVNLGVGYESDLARVEQVALEVLREVQREVPGAVEGFEPVIRFNLLGDVRVGFTAVMRAKTFTDQFVLRHEFIKRLHRRFRDEGIAMDAPFAMRETGAGQPGA